MEEMNGFDIAIKVLGEKIAQLELELRCERYAKENAEKRAEQLASENAKLAHRMTDVQLYIERMEEK